MSENDVTESSNKTHKTIQILSLSAGVVLFGLLYFGIFGAGIPLYLALGFVNILLTTVFTDIFIRHEGWYEKLKVTEGGAFSVAFFLGLFVIVCATLGYMTSGVVLSFGISHFLMGVFNLLRFLNENFSKSTKTEDNFLKLFYKTENTTLAISILNCLSLGVMFLCGYCNLAFAISFGAPLLGVSLILKLGVLLYNKLKKLKDPVEVESEHKNENENEEQNLKDDQIPPQDEFNEKSEEKNQGAPPGPTQ